MASPLVEKISKLTNRQTMAVGVALGVLYFFGVFDSGAAFETQLSNAKKELADEAEKQKKTREIMTRKEEVKNKVVKLNENFIEASKRLPSELKQAQIIDDITLAMNTTGSKVRSLVPKPASKKDLFEEIPVQVEVAGSFAQLTQFLLYLHTLERITKVKNIEIKHPQASGAQKGYDPRGLQMKGEVVSFRYLEEQEREVKPGAKK